MEGMERFVKTRILCIALCILTAFLMVRSSQNVYEAMSPHGQSTATVLRLSCYASEEHPSALSAQYFAELVDEKTEGRIRIQVVSGAELGSDEAAIEQLGFGGIAFAVVNTLSGPSSMVRLSGGKTCSLDREMLDRQRISLLGSFSPDYRCIASSRGLITSAAECRGMNIGAYSSGLLEEGLEQYGFSVMPLSRGDAVSSVHYGYIDSVELALMSYATEEYAKTLLYLSFYDGLIAPDVLLCSQVSMGNLAAEDQLIIRKCALYAETYQKTILRERQDSAAAKLIEQGVAFYPEEIPHMPSSQWETLRGRFIGGGITYE